MKMMTMMMMMMMMMMIMMMTVIMVITMMLIRQLCACPEQWWESMRRRWVGGLWVRMYLLTRGVALPSWCLDPGPACCRCLAHGWTSSHPTSTPLPPSLLIPIVPTTLSQILKAHNKHSTSLLLTENLHMFL